MRLLQRSPAVRLAREEWTWLAGAIFVGGIVGPVLLMLGLSAMPAAQASLLLNAEGVLTALIAWFVFKENVDKRIALGMAAIVAGAIVLSWPTGGEAGLDASLWPTLAVLGACLAWAVDNNLTRKVSLTDASFIAMSKGLVAGSTNLLIALIVGASLPGVTTMLAGALLGFASFGASLTLFVVALRHLGTARTGAYFSVAPFFGAILSVLILGEMVTTQLLVAGTLMALGVWLHLSEDHVHTHRHEAMEHSHEHQHGADEHHGHEHGEPVAAGTRHTHTHSHSPIEHAHPHYPDAHHRHAHD